MVRRPDGIRPKWRRVPQRSFAGLVLAASLMDHDAIATGQLASMMGRQLRSALATASMHSRSQSIPPTILLTLVRGGGLTMRQAVAVASQNPNATKRADNLAALVPELPDGLLRSALAAARTIDEGAARATALCSRPRNRPTALDRRGLECRRRRGERLLEGAGDLSRCSTSTCRLPYQSTRGDGDLGPRL